MTYDDDDDENILLQCTNKQTKKKEEEEVCLYGMYPEYNVRTLSFNKKKKSAYSFDFKAASYYYLVGR